MKKGWESRHLRSTPGVVLNQSPVLPFEKIALCAVLYRFSMTCMLALMLCFLIVAQCGFMPNSANRLLRMCEDMIQILLLLKVLFVEDSQVEYLLCGAHFCSEIGLRFFNDLPCMWVEPA